MRVLPIGSLRSQFGLLGGPMLAVCILIAVCLASLAVDFGHVGMVRTELQNACDAAALAGAQDLYTDPDGASTRALLIAAGNRANGLTVSSSSPGTTVTVDVTPPAGLLAGQVEVTASMRIRHLLAAVFGRFEDVITARSVAGGSSLLRRLNAGKGFPLAVSLEAPGPSGWALRDLRPGDTIDLNINSQQQKNAAWTSFTVDPPNSRYVSDAIDYSLGLSTSGADRFLIPPVKIGDSVNLINGVSGQASLGRPTPQNAALVAAPTLILPVVTDLPPMNRSSQVVGFVGVDVTSVTLHPGTGEVLTISGTLKPIAADGDDCPSCPAGYDSASFEALAARTVSLVE